VQLLFIIILAWNQQRSDFELHLGLAVQVFEGLEDRGKLAETELMIKLFAEPL